MESKVFMKKLFEVSKVSFVVYFSVVLGTQFEQQSQGDHYNVGKVRISR